MFHNTLSNFKNAGKKGVDFVKSLTIDSITAIKQDIAEKKAKDKAFTEWYETVYKSKPSEKSE